MIKFGPSGNSEEFYAEGHERTEEAAGFVRARGLDCFEYSFGRGVRMGAAAARSIGAAFEKAGVEISAHAPYFVNLANPDPEMAEKSFGYILSTAEALRQMGGRRVVFHPAAQGKEAREISFQRTLDRMKRLRDELYAHGFEDFMFCPETMGKLAQIGTVEEIAALCEVDRIFTPCVDFGHVNARERGSLKTERDFERVLEVLIDRLGYERVERLHIHFSKIQYGAKGEIRHLTFDDKEYGPEFEPLCEALIKLSLRPYLVCESAGTQTRDAAIMKSIYLGMKNA